MHYYEQVPEVHEILSLNPGTTAFLFDMDGTLINTEGLHARAFFSLLEAENLDDLSSGSHSKERLYDLCLGQTDERIFGILRENNLLTGKDLGQLRAMKNALYISYLEALQEEEEVCLPEIGRFLREIHQAGHKMALVTSSDRESAQASMNRFGFSDLFQLMITEESTERNKPHPDPYHLACEKLGATPKSCVVFEDSPTGLLAAKEFSPGAIIHARWY